MTPNDKDLLTQRANDALNAANYAVLNSQRPDLPALDRGGRGGRALSPRRRSARTRRGMPRPRGVRGGRRTRRGRAGRGRARPRLLLPRAGHRRDAHAHRRVAAGPRERRVCRGRRRAHYGTPNAFNALATKKDRAAQSAAFAALVRWCRAHRAAHLDDCGEVDVTALGLDCGREHGEEMPGEHSLAWEAATTAAADWEDSRAQVRGR